MSATQRNKSTTDVSMANRNSKIENRKSPAGATRRQFVQVLGAGLMIAVLDGQVFAQRGGGGGRRGGGGFGAGARGPISARVHIAKDGTITVLVGKVEGGQGARAELTQAAAEELRLPADRVTLVMGDTAQVPDDGITAGSMTTPRTLPAVREGTAAAREMLVAAALAHWGLNPGQAEARDGKVIETAGKREISYGDLVGLDEKLFAQAAPGNVAVTPVNQWKVMGSAVARPNRRGVVTGEHQFPSDITHPGMLHGKILRPPAYGAKLTSVDLSPAKAMPGVALVQDQSFVGVAAPRTFQAEQALDLIAKTAKWDAPENPSSDELFDYLAKHAQEPANLFADEVKNAAKSLKVSYHVAYAQHAPLEPRAACALWEDGKLTVWTGTQNPFGVRGELMRAFGLSDTQVRVIVPDFGGGFGGKHTGECAVEAARLAKGVGKPVSLVWTREEEFTWAYFRPAALINAEATLDKNGALTSWHFVNINSGGAAVESPYALAKKHCVTVGSNPPLRQGSYRSLAATANNFARESFMDELAAAAGKDPLEFRLAHLDNPRLKAVLEEAAKRFDWTTHAKQKDPNVGVGLSCGTDKGGYLATCAQVEIKDKQILVRRATQVFECGAIVNPGNLLLQAQGALVMGLGPALREEIRFKNGAITNGTFFGYPVPRFADLPELDVHLLNRPDLPSSGAGETPIIGIAPAIANAVFHATGQRIRSMPIRLG